MGELMEYWVMLLTLRQLRTLMETLRGKGGRGGGGGGEGVKGKGRGGGGR